MGRLRRGNSTVRKGKSIGKKEGKSSLTFKLFQKGRKNVCIERGSLKNSSRKGGERSCALQRLEDRRGIKDRKESVFYM